MVDYQANVLKTVILPQNVVNSARSTPNGEAMLHKAIKFDKLREQKDAYHTYFYNTT